MPSVIFLKVPDNTTKMLSICQTAGKHFAIKEKMLITVPNQQSAVYVDQLLWRLPADSFLPHSIATGPSQDMITISLDQNWNQASILFNLCPAICSFSNQFGLIYELMDETQPDKQQNALQKKEAYVNLGYSVREENVLSS